MEVTGQAFEDMQEQNSRLIQQLREKDDANFKLMSERIKSNQVFPSIIFPFLLEKF
jgi:E3 ubiquitin-protein ligase BRE1